MRILIATEFFPESATGEITGGVESRAFYLAKELGKRNKVFVLTSRRPGAKDTASFSGLQIQRVGPAYKYTQTGHLIKRILFSLSASIAAAKIAKRENLDVVDAYNFFTYPISLFLPHKAVKKYLTYHEVWVGSWAKNTNKIGFFGELSERIILLLARLRKTDIIAVSDFTKQALIKNKISADRITVIHNGVNISGYSKIKSIKEKNPTVCFVGRLTKNKRVEDLVAAMGLLRKDFNNLKCKIIGSGPEESNLRKLVSKSGLEKNVQFTGYLNTHELVLKELKSSHIFCSPSIVEGFGITLVEAIALGVPFVCSDIPPFKEISGGRGGLHFKSQDPADLASKIKKLLEDKHLYTRCIAEETGLAKAFGWEKLSKELEVEYAR
jgi:glycosyltransferase involved in cell wall biosynthesis